MRKPMFSFPSLLLLLLLGFPARALDLEAFEKKLTMEKLENGLTLLVYERPTAPVVSFFTYVDVGSAQEVPGITGLAHMFEHMAFKGTSQVGTRDAAAEKAALARVDEAYSAYQAEKYKVGGADPARLAELESAFERAQEEADRHVVQDEFSEIVDREGGVGLNAFTNADTTGYMMSFPANKVELWAHLESSRFLDPVFRQFYKERSVVQEERRMRTESQPIGRLIEKFQSVAFEAHPYHHPTVGYMSDLQAFSRLDAARFYELHYAPSSITIAIVGDVDAKVLMPMLRKYFSRLPARAASPPLRTEEPKQIAEKTIVMPDPSQPVYIEGYHRPSEQSPDDAAYDALADILSTGRTSRLHRSLVRDKKIAVAAAAFNGFPGSKYPNLMLFFAISTPGHGNEENRDAIRAEIERVRTEPVSDDELKMVKTRAKAGLIRSLTDNGGIAQALATYQARFGDWRQLFRSVERIESVTKEDILRVAQATFLPTNRTVGMIVTEEASRGAEKEEGR